MKYNRALLDEPLPATMIAQCQQGDRDAQQQLYESCHAKTHRLMVRLVGLADAADLTQRVFLRVFGKIGQFASHARLETWIHRVATNEALQYLRYCRRHPAKPLEREPVDTRSDCRRGWEQRDLLRCAMQRLEPGQASHQHELPLGHIPPEHGGSCGSGGCH